MSKVVKLSVEPARAGAPNEIGDPAENPIVVRDGLDLLAAFGSIGNEEVRRALIILTHALAAPNAL